MKQQYFKKYPSDYTPEYGRGAFCASAIYTRPHRPDEDAVQQAEFLQRIWLAWLDHDFVVGPHYIASWLDRPLGFSMHKVWSPSIYLDRCVIENPDDSYSYALFDLASQSGYGKKKPEIVIYRIHEYHFSAEDETLIKISI